MGLATTGRGLLAVLSLLFAADEAAPRRTNHLAGESSPYLLQHVHNPVDWYPWSPAALEKARQEKKLVFLSVGYSTCHWCHVMERESFSNPKIAALLNQHFVCIKVDREERPDIDQLYMTALQVMGQTGGWPLTMFLSADGKPIAGGTYWPPEDREVDGERLPGLSTILNAVIAAQQQDPENLRQTADLRANQTRRALLLQAGQFRKVELSRALVTEAVEQITALADREYGGFGRPPEFTGAKFPQPAYLQFLQAVCEGIPNAPQQAILDQTLTQMARSGLYDQLGGGFHRYSTERTWTVPHFEKMLYDNAQLLEIYAREYRKSPSPLYQRILRETADFIAREMTATDGGFYTALDADTEGVEGRYYVWTERELEDALPDDATRTALRRLYRLDGAPNFEEQAWVLTLAPEATEDEIAALQAARRDLLTRRQQRPRPATDQKLLTSWNGLMIAGLAEAGRALDDARLIQTASTAADFLLDKLQAEDGKLWHVFAAAPGEPPQARIPGYLDDYTHLVHGLLTLHDVTGDDKWLKASQRLTAVMIQQFYDADRGGFFFTAEDHEELFVRLKDQHDGVQPSGNSQAAWNLLVLAERTQDDRYRQLARATMQSFAGALEQHPTSLTTLARTLLRDLSRPEANDTP